MASLFQSFRANRHPKGKGEWSDANSKVEDLFETGSAIAFYNFEDKEPRRGEMFYEFFGDDLTQIRNLVQGTGYRLVFPMDFDAIRSMATAESDDYWHYHFPGLRSLREKGVEGAYMNLVRKMDMAPLFFHLHHHLMVEGDSGNRAGWHLLLVNKGNPMQHTWLGQHGDLVSELSMGDSVLRFDKMNPANEYEGSLILKSTISVNEARLIQEPSRVNEDEVVLDILKAENGDPSLLLLRKMLEQILKYSTPQRLELLASLEPLVMAGRSKDQPLSMEVRVSEQCLNLKVGLSTLINLLLRFYDPDQGRITLDGQDLRQITLKSLRHQIGIVPQETTLFSGTIAENIAYGQPDLSPAQIQQAATIANAHGFIQQFSQGYHTWVGERGVTLSGGQRQRIAIARAIVSNPRILILDEATSALDSESEALVQEALDRAMADRTVLIIAHRLSTVRKADRILFLEAGKILEAGTHPELIAQGSRYAQFYTQQFQG